MYQKHVFISLLLSMPTSLGFYNCFSYGTVSNTIGLCFFNPFTHSNADDTLGEDGAGNTKCNFGRLCEASCG